MSKMLLRKKQKLTQKMYLIIRSILEPIIALTIFVLLLPAYIIVAILIKRDSTGPVFLQKHMRIGCNHKIFRMFKFRTMKTGYDKVSPGKGYKENMYKLDPDPRVTVVGKKLRESDLDELPQLINIILGQMSFVGPRCFQPEEEKEYKRKYPNLRELVNFRTKVKPGLTGLWQISGRNSTTLKKRLELDKEYIDNISPLIDLKIVYKTIQKLITRKWQ